MLTSYTTFHTQDLKELPPMTDLGTAVPLTEDYEDHNKPHCLKISELNNEGVISKADGNSNHV